MDEKLKEWLALGEELRQVDEAKYEEVMRGLRQLIDAQHIIQRYDWQLMFRGRPSKRYRA